MPLKSMVQFAGRLGFKSVSVHSWADVAPSVLQKVYKFGVCQLPCATQIGVSEHYLKHLRRHLTWYLG